MVISIIYSNTICILSEMGVYRYVEECIFERMHAHQNMQMKSKTILLLYMLSKLILQDVFLLMMFIVPIPVVQHIQSLILREWSIIGGQIQICILLVLSLYLTLFFSKWKKLQQITGRVNQVAIPIIEVSNVLLICLCTQSALGGSYIITAISITNILLVVFITLGVVSYNFTKRQKSANYFQRRYNKVVVVFIKGVYCIFAVLIVLRGGEHWRVGPVEATIYSYIKLVLSIIKVKQTMFLNYYLLRFSQQVYSMVTMCQLSLILVISLYCSIPIELILSNLLPLVLLMTILSYLSLRSYVEDQQSEMYLSSITELKDQRSIFMYLDCLSSLAEKVKNQEQSIILISLKRKHQMNCVQSTCFCHKSQSLPAFIREYITSQLQGIRRVYHSNSSILISILYFKLTIFQFYPEILSKLSYLQSHTHLSSSLRFTQFCLQNEVKAFINKRNYEINSVQSQNLFKLEETRHVIQVIIKSEIETRCKMWRYLSRGLCRVGELQASCNAQISNIKEVMGIYTQFKLKFKKSKQFNLLLLFYFSKVSFLNVGKQLRKNLKEIYFGYKEEELYNIKQFKKYIYHKQSCAIQTLIEDKNMGIITAVSRNIQEMFGFTVGKIMGMSVNRLMPQFMAVEHDIILDQWSNTGTWRTIGKLKEIFCIHKDQYCFSALIYLKLYIKNNSLHFITSIFKLNDNDYMVLNPDLRIEGLGRRFFKILGESAKKIKLQLLVQNYSGFLKKKPSQQIDQNKLYKQTFISLKNMQSAVQEYLQELNSKFTSQKKQLVDRKFHQTLLDEQAERYQVQFSLKSYKMRSVKFIIICLKDIFTIRQIGGNAIGHNAVHNSGHTAGHSLSNNNITANSQSLSPNAIPVETDAHIRRQQTDNQSSWRAFRGEESQDHGGGQQLYEQNAGSSLTSTSEKENFPLSKAIEKFISLVEDPSNIRDTRLVVVTITIFTLIILMIATNFFAYVGYKQTLFQIEGVFFADGAVSDNMQMSQIVYNQLYVLQSLISSRNYIQFDLGYKTSQYVREYLYSLIAYDFERLINDVTQLRKARYYEYITLPAIWINIHGESSTLDSLQFLENFYCLGGNLMLELKEAREGNRTFQGWTQLSILYSNFGQMKRINEYFLDYYQMLSAQSHQSLNSISIIALSIFLLLSLICAVVLNSYYKFRFDQNIDSFTVFRYIPNHYIEKLKDYYSQMSSTVLGEDKLRSVSLYQQQLFSIDPNDFLSKDNGESLSTLSKIKFLNYTTYYRWIGILAVFIAINSANYIVTLQIRNFFGLSQYMMDQVNALMRSQNKMLQAYFDLKSAYYINATQYITPGLVFQLQTSLNQTQTAFVQVADRFTTLFQSYDPSFQESFVNTLVNNICNLTSPPVLNDFMSEQCRKMKLNMLDGGILISMTYFERNIREALIALSGMYAVGDNNNNNLNLNNTTPYDGDYFQQQSFRECDKMLFYMFKIYQATQACIYQSYIKTIYYLITLFLNISFVLCFSFVLGIIFWLRSIKSQKWHLANLYGHLLLIPFIILKASNRIAGSLKENIQYEQ